LAAFRQHCIVDAVISSVINPYPYGDDGENTNPDTDFEEKALRLLYTYTVSCRGELSKGEKENLRNWIQDEKKKEGEKQLLEKWGITREEYAALIGRIL